MALSAGSAVGPYRILSALGAGGMGEVYRAHDPRLGRDVAVKIIASEGAPDPSRLRRFEVEARALAALDHPHILAVHDVGTHLGQAYIVCELLEGETLHDRLARGCLPVRQSVELAGQICDALTAAHARGIVHRDLKPQNLFLTGDGRIKVLDFGLAKLSRAVEAGEQEDVRTRTRTDVGVVLGTVGYMSPEQARGLPADPRSDAFALGAVLYEMLSGRRAFAAATPTETLWAIVHQDPPEIGRDRRVPEGLERLVRRCLEKDPEKRFQSARDVAFALDAVSGASGAPRAPSGDKKAQTTRRWRPSIVLPALLGLAAALLALVWLIERGVRRQWARHEAIPEAVRLAEQDKYVAAFDLARQAETLAPDDPRLAALWPEILTEISIVSTPSGATVSAQEYASPQGEWRSLGQSPIERVRFPRGYFRWRLSKAGFATVERAGPAEAMEVKMLEERDVPPGMVFVSGGDTRLFVAGFAQLPRVGLSDYWIDRYEVTNREFRQFVASGGYAKKEYWPELDFAKGGRRLSWAEAIKEFRDTTGQPGPATWELGDYPAGQADLPVTGVSWYEAAAYAAFVGKSLPTLYDWFRASGIDGAPFTVPASNFGAQRLARVGEYAGLGPYGSYDMAGNAREWCSNATADDSDERYILGGAWNEPAYMHARAYALPRFDRSPTNGFRGVKRISAVPVAATQAVRPAFRDFSKEQPVPEKTFQLYRSLYSYDPAPLNATVESEVPLEKWTVQRVAFDAAYDGQRVPAYLLLPRGTPPPYQTVVYYPGGNAFIQRTREDFDLQLGGVEFLASSGRALMFPIYQGSYERGSGPTFDPWTASRNVWRDHVLQVSKDLGRSIDYLETRPDIDHEKLAYFGLSRGAGLGAVLPAVESRLRAAVLVLGGFYPVAARPEVDQINFAPRVTIPVLMLNGRYDFLLPPQSCQLPMFQRLGTRAGSKTHVLLDIGHETPARHRLIRETLDWLDRHLGPVGGVR